MSERPPLRLPVAGSLGLFSALCLVAGVVVNARPAVGSLLWDCPIRSLFDVPCFSCGITRVYLNLSQGHLLDALVLAPLPFLAAVLALLAGGWELWARAARRPLPDRTIARWLLDRRFKMGLVLTFFGLWGYATVRSIFTGAP